MLASALVTAAAATAILISTGLAPNSPVLDPELPFTLSVPGAIFVILPAAVCWLLVEDHPWSAVGLALVVLALALPGFAAWAALPAQIRAALLAASPLAVAGIALVIHFWRRSTADRRTALQAVIVLTALASATQLAGYDPFFDPDCSWTCQAAPAILAGVLGSHAALIGSAALSAAASVVATASAARSRDAPVSLRVAGTVAAVIVAAVAVLAATPSARLVGTADLNLLAGVGTAAIAFAALTEVIKARRVRRNVREVVKQLSSNRDGPSVRLVLDQWTRTPQVLSSITPASRLALENARLQAVGELRLAEVRASQRRIVEATDLERRRIERDLHDGAQQRLVAVAMHLNSPVDGADSAMAQRLSEAAGHVRQALAALRELSHDSLGAVLVAEGLEAAIEELVATTPLQVDLQVTLTGRHLPSAVQTTTHLIVAAGLDNIVKHASTDQAWVSVIEVGNELTIQVADDGQGGADLGPGLAGLVDRVGALDGHLDLSDRPGGGTVLSARIPCGL